MTLKDIATAINNSPGAPVSAAVVQVTPGQFRLVLTGRATGADNAFTVGFSTPLCGGEGLTFVDTDNNGRPATARRQRAGGARRVGDSQRRACHQHVELLIDDVIPA